MKVYIVVLTFQNYEDTLECLESLAGIDYHYEEVVVVDNASGDGSVERLERDFPSTRFIKNRKNLGYAGGNNVGITYALERGADAVWLLNNDTVPERDALTKLVEAAQGLPDAGILGSLTRYYDDPRQVHFAGGRLVKSRGKGLHVAPAKAVTAGITEPHATDFATGASMLVRKEMIETVGLLDEAYYLYLEDLDWCLRARKSGWETYLVPASVVYHKINRTTQIMRPRIIYYVCRNSLYLCRRHFPCYLPLVLTWCLYSYNFAYLVKWLLKGSKEDLGEHLKMGWRGISDYFSGSMGEYGDDAL